jgi:hypothetical protein
VYLARAEPQDDAAKPIREQIAKKEAELTGLERRAVAIAQKIRKAQEQTQATDAEIAELVETVGINRQKRIIGTEIDELERKLDQTQWQPSAIDVARTMHELIDKLDTVPTKEQYELRAKINKQLRRFIVRIDFDDQGQVTVIFGYEGKPLKPAIPEDIRRRGGRPMAPVYPFRFNPDGSVERKHPNWAILVQSQNRIGAGLPVDELRDAWYQGAHRRQHLRPNEKSLSPDLIVPSFVMVPKRSSRPELSAIPAHPRQDDASGELARTAGTVRAGP